MDLNATCSPMAREYSNPFQKGMVALTNWFNLKVDWLWPATEARNQYGGGRTRFLGSFKFSKLPELEIYKNTMEAGSLAWMGRSHSL